MKKKYKTILIILVISIILLLYYLNQSSNEEFKEQTYELPKIVWSYWNSDSLPEQIKLIYENNKKILNGWEYILLNDSNKYEYIDIDDDTSIKNLSPEHYADWIRLYLLKKYGGVWMDISILLNENFDRLRNKSLEIKSELTGFDSPIHEDNSIDLPVVENSFIMAPKNSNLISLWYDEYMKAIKQGFKEYKMEQIQNGVNYQNIFGKGNDNEVYLTQHGCLQVVFQKRLTTLPRMYLESTNKSMYKIHYECSWDKKCLQEKINDTSYSKKIPYIKLRGIDRKDLDLTKYFQN
jgi:hypothetical protein